MTGWSFRGAAEGGEPGIRSPRSVVMESGLATFGGAPRSDAACDSNFENTFERRVLASWHEGSSAGTGNLTACLICVKSQTSGAKT
jgi:hypothetical protein